MLTPGCLAPETDSGSGNQAPLSPRSFQEGTPISSTQHQGSRASERVRSCPGSWGEDCRAREGWAGGREPTLQCCSQPLPR